MWNSINCKMVVGHTNDFQFFLNTAKLTFAPPDLSGEQPVLKVFKGQAREGM